MRNLYDEIADEIAEQANSMANKTIRPTNSLKDIKKYDMSDEQEDEFDIEFRKQKNELEKYDPTDFIPDNYSLMDDSSDENVTLAYYDQPLDEIKIKPKDHPIFKFKAEKNKITQEDAYFSTLAHEAHHKQQEMNYNKSRPILDEYYTQYDSLFDNKFDGESEKYLKQKWKDNKNDIIAQSINPDQYLDDKKKGINYENDFFYKSGPFDINKPGVFRNNAIKNALKYPVTSIPRELEAREMESFDFLNPKTKLQRNVFRKWFD